MSDDTFESRETTPEVKEETEQKKEASLEDSTVNPGTRVEQNNDFNTAEAIETALTTSINNTLVEAAASEKSDDGSELMLETEAGAGSTPGEGVTATPINLPNPVESQVAHEDHWSQEAGGQGASSGREGVSATPINVPSPVENQAASGPEGTALPPEPVPDPPDPGMEVGNELTTASGREGAGATPIVIPNPVENEVGQSAASSSDQVARDRGPIEPTPPPDLTAAPAGSAGSEGVGATPINLPNPVESQVAHEDHWSQETAGQSASSGREGVGATPINVPSPVENQAASGQGASSGREGVGATPINVPSPVESRLESAQVEQGNAVIAEEEEPGPLPFPQPADEAVTLEGSIRETGVAAENDWEAPNADVLSEAEDAGLETGSEEIISEELPPEEDIPEDAETGETSKGETGEGTGTGKYYMHENDDGSITVVDENGKPVDSPPQIVKFKGKYYAVYPGDDLPVKEDGTVTDPKKLSQYEIPSYKASPEGLKVYTDQNGNTKVVDENGKEVESPPQVIQDPQSGKYYFVTETDPGKLSKFLSTGNFKDALAQGLVKEAIGYKPSADGLKLYTDQDGNTKVVDGNGNPVESPPQYIQDPQTGKYYFLTETDPGKLSSLTKSGNFKDALAQGLIKEAAGFKPSADGLKLYTDQDGSIKVVDENGNPVESPPQYIRDPQTGKYYFLTETDPGKLSSLTKSGNFKDALAQGLIKEAAGYKPSTDGMKIYTGQDGSIKVVDGNGKPVESPPQYIRDPQTGKYYFLTETDPGKLSSLTKSGNFKDALAQGLIQEAPGYKPSADGLKLHTSQDGTITVVDENGKAVETPPPYLQDPTTGKYYFLLETDPGKLSSLTKSGNFKDALAQGLIQEAPGYKPSWWGK